LFGGRGRASGAILGSILVAGVEKAVWMQAAERFSGDR
jgi:ABC-type branched-subunit amino acid transport system permease subunit